MNALIELTALTLATIIGIVSLLYYTDTAGNMIVVPKSPVVEKGFSRDVQEGHSQEPEYEKDIIQS